MSPPSHRSQALMLACWWVQLLLTAGGLVLMLTVNIWGGLALVLLGCTYAVVVIPRLRTRLGFNRWRGGWAR